MMQLFFAICALVLNLITVSTASPHTLAGSRLEHRQQPPAQMNADGTCASYTTKSGDYCWKIATEHGIQVSDLESFNKQTWGWKGCDGLDIDLNICVSAGEIPMPMAKPNAVCGPQVAGTPRPANMSTLATLNPCRLNACCNAWGSCGSTEEFCSKTIAPGCISNCGSDIIKSDPPASFLSVAYFQSFSTGRKCLRMNVSQIDTGKYTHVNFAFASITSTFDIDVSSVQSQFDDFVKLDGTKIKRIISIGGGNSDEAFRFGTRGANATTFVANIANFLKKYNLDGVDIDWEYPLPVAQSPGVGSDSAQFLRFIMLLREEIPSQVISIAVPPSFTNLQGFRLKQLYTLVDYVLFMAYDLHGQWDYALKNTLSGCPDGSCLRSHVNLTETMSALSMITKAGVPSNKVVVGIASYGRAFHMTTKGCSGPLCTFTGKDSGAKPGRCTETPGFLAQGEIEDIRSRGSNVQIMYDSSSGSDIVVYDDLEWVAYMSESTKKTRTNLYKQYNFGGVVDWAVDLQGPL